MEPGARNAAAAFHAGYTLVVWQAGNTDRGGVMSKLQGWMAALLLGASAAGPAAAQTLGGGIPRVTFEEAEVGKRIWQFKGLTERVPKAMMFQGYMVIFSNRCQRLDVLDIANPRAPVNIRTFTFAGQGDDHTVPTAGTMVMDGGTLIDLANPAAPKVVGTNAGFYGSVWPAFQWPYFYSTRSYDDGAARSTPMYIVDYANPGAGRRVKEVGVQGILGFTTGSTQVVGNLLIVTSGDQYSGVSTWDLSDPVNPKVLDIVKTGPGIYTSQMYGKYLVSSGPQNLGQVGFFDISDPTAIRMEFSETVPGMGDYAGFQNGFMFGGEINSGKWIKYDIKARKVVLTGTVPNKNTSRYCYPFGNMVWLGDAGRDGLNGTANQSDLFVHQANPDSIPPSVQFTSPANGQPRQALTSRVGIAFDEEVDNRTLTTANVLVRPRGGPAIQGIYGHTMGVVNFTPSQPLQPNTTYEVVIPAGSVKDWTGNPILKEYGLRFSTGTTVEGGPWINDNTGVGIASVPVWRERPRLSGELAPGGGSLVFRMQGGAPRGMARNGRMTLSDLNGRVLLRLPVGTDALAKGWVMDFGRGTRIGRGLYRARLEAGSVNMTCAVYLPRGN